MKLSFLPFFTGLFLLFGTTSYAQGPVITCGNSDHADVEDRYVTNSKWNCPIIPFFIVNGTEDIAGTGERTSILAALSTWEAAANIRFVETCDEATALVTFTFLGDHTNIDNGIWGPLVAGHAGFPGGSTLPGDVHFNDGDMTFTTATRPNNSQPIDLQSIALHETGHALGLDHSDVASAVMHTPYNGSKRTLTQDDINGIRSLYGAPDVSKLITGLPYVCHYANYSLCLPPGLPITWSVSSNLVITSGQGTSTIRVERANTYNQSATVTATVNTGCGTPLTITRQVVSGYTEPLYAVVGPTPPDGGYPPQSYFTPCFIPYNYFTVKVQSQYAISYGWEWVSGPGYINYSSSNTSSGHVDDNGQLTIKVTYLNAQGCLTRNQMIIVNYKQEGLTVNPNPADDVITVSFDQGSLTEVQQEYADLMPIDRAAAPELTPSVIKSVRIYDVQGRMVLEHLNESGAEQEMLDITTLEAGTYFIEIFDGNNSKQVKSFVKQ